MTDFDKKLADLEARLNKLKDVEVMPVAQAREQLKKARQQLKFDIAHPALVFSANQKLLTKDCENLARTIKNLSAAIQGSIKKEDLALWPVLKAAKNELVSATASLQKSNVYSNAKTFHKTFSSTAIAKQPHQTVQPSLLSALSLLYRADSALERELKSGHSSPKKLEQQLNNLKTAMLTARDIAKSLPESESQRVLMSVRGTLDHYKKAQNTLESMKKELIENSPTPPEGPRNNR